MNVVVAGGTGFLGSAVARVLQQRGHKVAVLTRRPSSPAAAPPLYHWDPEREELDPNALEGAHAVVNLTGENLMSGRWTPARKRRLVESRVLPTRFLARRWKGGVLVNASAVGVYGDRGDEILTERSASGSGFLAELCREWEGAAREADGRVVLARFGPVLDPPGGLLPPLLPLFRLGLGGPIGTGRQWWSWIALADAAHAVAHAIERESIEGPLDVAAPEPVRQRDFARALGRALHRPTLLPAPPVALRIVLGEAADAVLASARVIPRVLSETGYRFEHPGIEEAIRSAVAVRARA